MRIRARHDGSAAGAAGAGHASAGGGAAPGRRALPRPHAAAHAASAQRSVSTRTHSYSPPTTLYTYTHCYSPPNNPLHISTLCNHTHSYTDPTHYPLYSYAFLFTTLVITYETFLYKLEFSGFSFFVVNAPSLVAFALAKLNQWTRYWNVIWKIN